jgi:FkbM family methyltransferase
MVRACDFKKDALLKLTTAGNLLLKGLSIFGFNPNLIEWLFDDHTVSVRFKDIRYRFYCPRHCDSNIYLNPYFHEADVTSFVYDHLENGDVFLDVGAHCGLYTILAGKRVGPEGKVISIEPNPENLILLNKNVKINELNNVITIPKAAGDHRTRIRLFYQRGATALTSYIESKNRIKSIEVETTKLDELVGQMGLSSTIKMIKIDTEGYDEQVLRGGKKTLRSTECLLVEEKSRAIKNFLAESGLKIFLLTPSQYICGIRAREVAKLHTSLEPMERR